MGVAYISEGWRNEGKWRGNGRERMRGVGEVDEELRERTRYIYVNVTSHGTKVLNAETEHTIYQVKSSGGHTPDFKLHGWTVPRIHQR